MTHRRRHQRPRLDTSSTIDITQVQVNPISHYDVNDIRYIIFASESTWFRLDFGKRDQCELWIYKFYQIIS